MRKFKTLDLEEVASENLLWCHKIYLPFHLTKSKLMGPVLALRQAGLLGSDYMVSDEGGPCFVTPTQAGVLLFLAVNGRIADDPGLLFEYSPGWSPPLERDWQAIVAAVPELESLRVEFREDSD